MPDGTDDDRTQSFIALTSGTQIGHYRIIEKIGSGGMGEVYLADDTELDRRVALKFLPPNLCQDEDCRKRFKREAQAAAKLSHPNIIHVYEVSEYQGRPFFAMEHVEGRSLLDIKPEEFDLDRIVGIAIQLCDGLNTAHAAGITHRDIKPSNMIIDSAGRPKLLDFGLATVKGGEHLTKTGSTLGTVGYMSPEQIDGKATDARSDLFSLGVVLYELTANKSPFRRDDEAATFKAILHDEPEPLARYKSSVPDDLQRIISKLLEKDPALRYQSAAGVIPDLKKLSPSRTLEIAVEKKRDWWNRYVVPTAVATLLIIVAIWYFGYRDRAPSTSGKDDRIMLAVLPFENLGDPEDEYFADGITDEVTSRLATLHSLAVISRTSTLQYKGTTKNLREIGAELGVQYILEGTIRWNKSGQESRVRIIPQLIRVSDDVHLWTEPIEAVLDDIFGVQTRIAEQVSSALDIALLGSEREALARRPTVSTEAYDYYLRAIQLEDISPATMDEREELFLRAISLDSTFALAYARLGLLHSSKYWFFHDHTEERLQKAREAIDKALSLSPNLVEAHVAKGMYHYRSNLDYGPALAELEIARYHQPNNGEVLEELGTVKRRAGMWEEALAYLRDAVKLNPKSGRSALALASTLASMGHFAEAEHYFDRAISLNSELSQAYFLKADMYVDWRGDTRKARETIYDGYVAVGRLSWLAYWEVMLDVFDRDFEHALQCLVDSNNVPRTMIGDSADYYVFKGDIFRYMGRSGLARSCYDSAAAILESKTTQRPEDVVLVSLLSTAYAGLGRKEEAIRLAKLAVELCPVTRDALDGVDYISHLAVTYASLGEYNLALDQLEYLASVAPSFSTARMRIHPAYEPLHDHPRFQALIEKYGGDQTGI